MRYYSTNDPGHSVSFEEATFRSLPLDNGLYFPEEIPQFTQRELPDLLALPKVDLALRIIRPFVGDEIPEEKLYEILEDTLDFDFPLVHVGDQIHALELFHGPTWAFKDVGARFLSRCMGYFSGQTGRKVTILAATSGDTGGAVAAGFHGIAGVDVKVLYPKGKVSDVQKKQLTTWGDNVEAFEVDGSFDDCQKMVKRAFLDDELNHKLQLSSANSINVSRLIPQTLYYFFAFAQLGHDPTKAVFSVPSGNFGNLTAGLLAWKMGLPIHRFIAATNINHVVPDYLVTGDYVPRPSVQTYANAMDVGNPSNFVRMLEVFGQEHKKMADMISGFYMSDDEIMESISKCHEETGYVLDPHGAIGYIALVQGLRQDEIGIFLETAHPVKFLNVMEVALSRQLDYTDKTSALMRKSEQFKSISKQFEDFKEILLR